MKLMPCNAAPVTIRKCSEPLRKTRRVIELTLQEAVFMNQRAEFLRSCQADLSDQRITRRTPTVLKDRVPHQESEVRCRF
jgi:hypothetical protein